MPGDPGRGLASRMDLNGNSEAPGSPRSPRDISRTGSGVKGTLNVDDATRQKVCHGVTAFATPSDIWGMLIEPGVGAGRGVIRCSNTHIADKSIIVQDGD